MLNPRERSQPINFLTFLSGACLLLCGIASAAPSITLSKSKGPPTTKIFVSGSGWGQNAAVDIYFDRVRKAFAVTDGGGNFQNVTIHAPRQAKPRKHWVTAVENNNGDRAQQPFIVQTDWQQAHFSPSHTGLNPYENVLGPSNVSNLHMIWRYGTDLSVVGAPAVVNGAVFIGSDDANVYALDADTGHQLWKFLTGGYVDSSPAVADGLVYIGSEDHNLYALDSKTGALRYEFNGVAGYSDVMVDGGIYVTSKFFWSFTELLQWDWRSAEDAYGSPATAYNILCVGGGGATGGATVSASGLNGQLIWQYYGIGHASSSPVLAEGRVYFALDQDLYALDASNGAVLWTYHTDGSVSTPALANGVVYAGSGDSHLYALDARTGTLLWKHRDPNNYVVESPSIANGVVYVGTEGGDNSYGTVSAVDAATGRLLWQYIADGAVLSSPVITNGVLYFGTHAGSVFAFGL